MVVTEEQKQYLKKALEDMFIKEEELLKRAPTEEELAKEFKMSKEILEEHLAMIGETYESIKQDAESHVKQAVSATQEPSKVVKEEAPPSPASQEETRRRIMQFLAVLKQAYEALERKLQRPPAVSDVASLLKMPEDELNQLLAALGIKLEDLKRMPSPTALITEQNQMKQILGTLLLAVNRLYKQNNRDPTFDEIATVLAIPKDKLEKLLAIIGLRFDKLVEEGKRIEM